MLPVILTIVFFATVKSQQCAQTNVCPSALRLCAALSPYSEQCKCLNTALALNTCARCIEVSSSVGTQCLQMGTQSRIDTSSGYDFLTCSACSKPPGDSYWPSTCTLAMNNFIDRLFPFNKTLILDNIPKICDTLGRFYEEFGRCGFFGVNADVLKQYVCDYNNQPEYQICECGTRNVGALGQKIITYLKLLNFRVAAYINARAGTLGTVSVDVTRTYNCDDRLVHSFTGTFDGAALKNAYAAYLGVSPSRIRVGIDIQDSKRPDGKCVSVVDFTISSNKRAMLTAQQATVQVLNSASSLVISQLVLLLLAIIYFF
jgi:hypothetical protein